MPVDGMVTGGFLHLTADAVIANADNAVAAVSAAYTQAEVNAIVTAYNDLATKFNALLVELRSNGASKA